MVLDVFSRRIVGWAMGPALKTELMVPALEMAVEKDPTNFEARAEYGFLLYRGGDADKAMRVTN